MVGKLLRSQQNCKERIEQQKRHLTVSNRHSCHFKNKDDTCKPSCCQHALKMTIKSQACCTEIKVPVKWKVQAGTSWYVAKKSGTLKIFYAIVATKQRSFMLRASPVHPV